MSQSLRYEVAALMGHNAIKHVLKLSLLKQQGVGSVVATGLEEAERDVIRDKLEAAGLRPRLDPSTRKARLRQL
eukprot:222543-Pelagomonas_calceolata.AAC.2